LLDRSTSRHWWLACLFFVLRFGILEALAGGGAAGPENMEGKSMRPRDWFLVGIRLIGAWAIYRGVNEAANLLSVIFGVQPQRFFEMDFDGSSLRASKNYVLYALTNLAFGLYFVFGGEEITKWVFDEYPRESDDEVKAGS
jgi:hypothetical protein